MNPEPTNLRNNGTRKHRHAIRSHDPTSGEIHTIKPLKYLPIPVATRSRSLPMQDAARLYIHYGYKTDGEIARSLGLTTVAVRNARLADDWDGVRDVAIVDKMGTTEIDKAVSIKATQATEAERMAQRKMVGPLEKERGEILERLPKVPKGSKQYESLLNQVKQITDLIERYSGKADLDAELERRRLAIIRVKERLAVRQIERSEKDDTIELDDASVIDFMVAPELTPEKIGLPEISAPALSVPDSDSP